MTDEEIQRDKQKGRVLSDLDKTSKQISDSSRVIGYGLAAISFTLYSSDSEFAENLLQKSRNLVLAGSLCGVLTILLDYLQFLFGFLDSLSVKKKAASEEEPSWKYLGSWKRKGRFLAFVGKQILAVVGVTFIICAFISAFQN